MERGPQHQAKKESFEYKTSSTVLVTSNSIANQLQTYLCLQNGAGEVPQYQEKLFQAGLPHHRKSPLIAKAARERTWHLVR